MATLPTAAALTGATTTNAQQKLFLAALRDVIADLLGTDSSNKAAARAALGVPALADFVAQLASPGYLQIPLPNGKKWIVQWGAASTGSDGRAVITFPVSFPTVHFRTFPSLLVTQVNAPFILGADPGNQNGVVLNACTTSGAGAAVSVGWFSIGW